MTEPRGGTAWDAVALGEVMLRLDPGHSRIRSAHQFDVYEGGGEYNVIRALASAFGMRTTVLTALTNNEVGVLAQNLIRAGGVDTSHILWAPFDDFGETNRVGLNFTERGFGVRPGVGMYDRANTAAAQLTPNDIDWQRLFQAEGVRWLHTGGIFAALSRTTGETTIAAVAAARAAGVTVSYDFNYRPSLWNRHAGSEEVIETNRNIASHTDVMIGNELDFNGALGMDITTTSDDPIINFGNAAEQLTHTFPNITTVAATIRKATSATLNDWSAAAWSNGELHHATQYNDLQIYDRVGGGDGFAAGLIFALLEGRRLPEAVEWGTAHGALVMTTPGDNSMVTRADVERLMSADDATTIR